MFPPPPYLHSAWLGIDTDLSVDVSWAGVSTEILLAELRRRGEDEAERPKCGGKNSGWYDTAAHIVALVLILVVSTLSKLSHGRERFFQEKLTVCRLCLSSCIETSPREQ